jgi:uncharacterized membrane protein HdeD (DUF308 family)
MDAEKHQCPILAAISDSAGQCEARQFHNQGWLALHGVINVLLRVLIWMQWPLPGPWAIGLVVGIDRIFDGWALIMLGIAARNRRLA